jgi:hypothetical protein
MLAIMLILFAIYWAMNMRDTLGAVAGLATGQGELARNPFVGKYEGWDRPPVDDE